jgi:hypothetical protein
MVKLCALFAMLVVPSFAQLANWTGPYEPCLKNNELRKTAHMSVGVRYDIPDAGVVEQFHRAFQFWSTVLNVNFFDEQSTACAVAIVTGTREILHDSTMVARAQLPERPGFQGWIAIDLNAKTYLQDADAVATWIHEIGHVLGLKHSRSARSLMYYLNVDASNSLEAADLQALASLHMLRIDSLQSLGVTPRSRRHPDNSHFFSEK